MGYGKKLRGRTLQTQKANTPFKILSVDENRILLERTATGSRHSYSRGKVEKYCAHRVKGGAITIKSLHQAGIELRGQVSPYTHLGDD